MKSTVTPAKRAKNGATKAARQSKSIPPATPPLDGLARGAVENPKSASTGTIRILVVDDHPLFRHGLVQLLNSDDGFKVCGEAGSAPEALTLVRKLKPHMAIVD